ncbi:MAG: hypothetical protein H6R39_220, partial [Deltaproteobacteria bacterium]|nr:hypothetical protein [Deltaproteobacteria bacterium]
FYDNMKSFLSIRICYGSITGRLKPVCIENIEVMWYVEEKGGLNAVKHEKN